MIQPAIAYMFATPGVHGRDSGRFTRALDGIVLAVRPGEELIGLDDGGTVFLSFPRGEPPMIPVGARVRVIRGGGERAAIIPAEPR